MIIVAILISILNSSSDLPSIIAHACSLSLSLPLPYSFSFVFKLSFFLFHFLTTNIFYILYSFSLPAPYFVGHPLSIPTFLSATFSLPIFDTLSLPLSLRTFPFFVTFPNSLPLSLFSSHFY